MRQNIMAAQKRTTTRRKTSTRAKRRSATNRNKGTGNLANFLVPFVFIVGITFCLGFLLLMGYRTATASAFFDVKNVDVRGLNRASKTEIENIVSRQAAKTGVWNADLAEIKNDVEKLTSVKTATVSRVLPDGVRLNIVEREPRAVVSLDSGEIWVDDEGVSLGKVGEKDERPPFVLKGWDESKTLKAIDENKERVKIYREMLTDWQDFELAKRVREVNLQDLQETQAIVQDSGEPVKIILGNNNYGKRLREALKAIANKGKEIESVTFNGQSFVAQPRES
jgi:cell division protein FtsQ